MEKLRIRYSDLHTLKKSLIHLAVTGGAVAVFGLPGFLVPVVLESYQALTSPFDWFDSACDLGEHLLGGLLALIIF